MKKGTKTRERKPLRSTPTTNIPTRGGAHRNAASYRRLRHRPLAGAGYCFYTLKRCLHRPHTSARGRPQRGEGAFDRHPTGRHQEGQRPQPPGASNKAKTQRRSAFRGPPMPLRRHRFKHQDDDGSSPNGSARQIRQQPPLGASRPTTGGAQSSQSDAARGPTAPPRPVIGHSQGPP